MNLYLSGDSHLNCLYTHESGHTLYKVTTPGIVGNKTSTIYKAVAHDFIPTNSRDSETRGDELNDDVLKDKLMVIGTILHKSIGKSILGIGETKIQAKEYFRRDGFGVHGYHRIFTGPDGQEYKWYMRTSYSELCLNNTEQTSIARFHPKEEGGNHQASLEISSEGMHFLDLIVITFVYIEKKREEP